MVERDFDAERKLDLSSFKISGRTFRTYPSLSITAVKLAEVKAKGKKKTPLEETLEFVRTFIVHEDRPRWDELLADPDAYIDANDLINISRHLVEQAQASRPDAKPATNRAANGKKPKSTAVKVVAPKKVQTLSKNPGAPKKD